MNHGIVAGLNDACWRRSRLWDLRRLCGVSETVDCNRFGPIRPPLGEPADPDHVRR